MIDTLDDRLATARRAHAADPAVATALVALADGRAGEARRARHRRIVIPSIAVGTVLAFSGGAAVAALQWGPWDLTEPDLVVARDWTDVTGAYLGSCETRIAANTMPADALALARERLASIDLDTIAPDAEVIAGALTAVGRLDEVGRLIPGAQRSDFDVHHNSAAWPQEWYSDARILQDGLMMAVFADMAGGVLEQHPELMADGISASEETQCTTDPEVR